MKSKLNNSFSKITQISDRPKQQDRIFHTRMRKKCKASPIHNRNKILADFFVFFIGRQIIYNTLIYLSEKLIYHIKIATIWNQHNDDTYRHNNKTNTPTKHQFKSE